MCCALPSSPYERFGNGLVFDGNDHEFLRRIGSRFRVQRSLPSHFFCISSTPRWLAVGELDVAMPSAVSD